MVSEVASIHGFFFVCYRKLWEHYDVASKVNKEEGDVQVAALLAAIGPEARKIFKTWNLSATERKDMIAM